LEEEGDEGGHGDDDETMLATPTPPSLLIAAAASAIMLRLFWLSGMSDMVKNETVLSIAKGLVVCSASAWTSLYGKGQRRGKGQRAKATDKRLL
jgi:hypothetical protein